MPIQYIGLRLSILPTSGLKKLNKVSSGLTDFQIVTTTEGLTEMLNFYAESSENRRDAAVRFIRSVLLNVDIEVIAPTNDGFLDGLTLYESRRDKGYSLTDCISMNICREYKISEVLTHDHHFTQEGFQILL